MNKNKRTGEFDQLACFLIVLGGKEEGFFCCERIHLLRIFDDYCEWESMKMKDKLDYRVYLVTDDLYLQGDDSFEILEECIAAGVTIVQYRAKMKTGRAMLKDAERIKTLTQRYKIPLIINDRVDLALAVDADGVHLGQNDLSYAAARKILGECKEIGVSANNYFEGKEAILAGADCVGIGPIYSTPTKKDAKNPCGFEPLRALKAEFPSAPLIAIGGITLANAEPVIQAGADGLAIISAIWNNEKPAAAVACFKTGWEKWK